MQEAKTYTPEEMEELHRLTPENWLTIVNIMNGIVRDLTQNLDQAGADRLQERVQLKGLIGQAKSLAIKANFHHNKSIENEARLAMARSEARKMAQELFQAKGRLIIVDEEASVPDEAFGKGIPVFSEMEPNK